MIENTAITNLLNRVQLGIKKQLEKEKLMAKRMFG